MKGQRADKVPSLTENSRKQEKGWGAEVDHQLAESNTIPIHIGLQYHYIKNWTIVHG